MMNPFKKKAVEETVEQTMETTAETTVETTVETTLETKTIGGTIGGTKEVTTVNTMNAGGVIPDPFADDDEEEYEYVTPHYGLNAFLLTVGCILAGAAIVFLAFRNTMAAQIKQAYIDQGYILTNGTTALAEDIAAGKTAYVNGELITGTYVPIDTSNASAAANDILLGYTAYVNGLRIQGTIPTFNPENFYMPGANNILIPKGYFLANDFVVSGSGELKPGNIKLGVTIFGVTGTYDE